MPTGIMPVDAVAAREAASSFPDVTAALAELNGGQIARGGDGRNAGKGAGILNAGVIAPGRRFAILVSERHRSIEDGGISINLARRLLAEVLELRKFSWR